VKSRGRKKGIGYKFLELVNFEKQGHELDSDLDKWYYLLKNLHKMDKIPSFLDKRIFQKVFKIAEMAKLTKEEREIYESNMKAKSDYDASLRWAAKQAAAEAAIEVAKKLKQENIPVEIIERSTGLSADDIGKL